MAINDVSDISFNNLAQNAKNYKSKIQDKKKNNYSIGGISKKTEKNISDLVISSNKAILLATKLANENNKKFSAQYTNIPDRLKQIKKEKAKIKRESTANDAKSPTMAVMSIDRNVKKIYNLLNRKFGSVSDRKTKNSLDASAAYDAKKLGIEGTGKTWSANLFSLISTAMRQSTLSSLKVDQDTYFHSRFGEGEKKKGFIGSAIRAYKVASDETTMSTQEKMVKALIEINNSLSGKDSVFRLTYERLLMEHAAFRNIVWFLKKGQDTLMAIPRIYRWATKSRGGYQSKLPRGKGTAEHTAAVLDMIYVDSMWRLDNIVHHLKQQYNLWNKYMMSQTGSSANGINDIDDGKYQFTKGIKQRFKDWRNKRKNAAEVPEYQKYQVTQKDLLEKQVKIGYTQIQLLRIIGASIIHLGSPDVAGKKRTTKEKRHRAALQSSLSGAIGRLDVGRIDADNRLNEDAYITNKKHPHRLLYWKAKTKLEKDKQSKFEKTQAIIEKNKKKIEDRRNKKIAKRVFKSYKKDPNGYAKDLNQQADENLSLAIQAGPARFAIAAGKKIGKSKIYKSTIEKMKGFNESASDKIDNFKNKAIAGTYKFLSPDSSPQRVREAARKQAVGQDNITDRLVLKMDQLISENSIANKLSRNSYRLSFKSFLADEKDRMKRKLKDSWLGKILGTGFGWIKGWGKSIIKSISMILGVMGVKGLVKSGMAGLSRMLFKDGFKEFAKRNMKSFGAKLMTGRGMAGMAGLGMMGYDAYGGVKKSKEWGTSKLASGIAGALGGTGDGGVGSALKGAAKGALIGSMIFPGIGTAIGGIAGGLLGYFGGKNIAKSLDGIMGGFKKAWEVIKKAISYPIEMFKWIGKKYIQYFTFMKEGLSSAISGAYAWLYDKAPWYLKKVLPKPKEAPKTTEESVKGAIATHKKGNSISMSASLVDPAFLSVVDKQQKNDLLARTSVVSGLQTPSPNKPTTGKKPYAFDNKNRLSPEEKQANVASQKIYAEEHKVGPTIARSAAKGLAALPTPKEVQTAGGNLWEKTKKFGRQLGSDAIYIANDLGNRTQDWINKHPKYLQLQKDLQKEYGGSWDKIKTFADIQAIKAEGKGRDWISKFNTSDFAHSLSIYATRAEWNWKKFKQSDLYKQASTYGITSEKRFNAAMAAVTNSPKYIKLQGAIANKENRWNENDIRQGATGVQQQMVSGAKKVQHTITDSVAYTQAESLARSQENREILVDRIVKKGRELGETVQENVSTVLPKQNLVHKKVRTDLVKKHKSKKKIISRKKLTYGDKLKNKFKKALAKYEKLKSDYLKIPEDSRSLMIPKTRQAYMAIEEAKQKLLDISYKYSRMDHDGNPKYETKSALGKKIFELGIAGRQQDSTKEEQINMNNIRPSERKKILNKKTSMKDSYGNFIDTTHGKIIDIYKNATKSIDEILSGKKQYSDDSDMTTINTSKGVLATERRTSTFGKKDLEQAKKTNQKGILLGIKGIDKQLITAKSKGDQSQIDKLLAARKKLTSKLDASNATSVSPPPVMTGKDIASAHIEQEKIKSDNQDKSLNKALSNQTTQINKNQKESTAHIVAANTSMANTIITNNNSSVQNSSTDGGSGNSKPQQSDAFADAVMIGQFDNFGL